MARLHQKPSSLKDTPKLPAKRPYWRRRARHAANMTYVQGTGNGRERRTDVPEVLAQGIERYDLDVLCDGGVKRREQ